MKDILIIIGGIIGFFVFAFTYIWQEKRYRKLEKENIELKKDIEKLTKKLSEIKELTDNVKENLRK